MFSPQRKIYITASIALLVFLCIIVFGIAPFMGKVVQSSRALASQKGLLDLLEARVGEAVGFQNEQSTLKQNLNRIEGAFIEPGAPVVFLDYLEGSAESSGLSMRVYPYSTELEPDDPWLSVGFRVTLGGKVENCLRFLEMLEQSKWLFEITQFSLEKIGEKNPYFKEFEELMPGDAYMLLILKAYSGEVPPPQTNPQQ